MGNYREALIRTMDLEKMDRKSTMTHLEGNKKTAPAYRNRLCASCVTFVFFNIAHFEKKKEK